jgi:peroxiredoxin Q/BCP
LNGTVLGVSPDTAESHRKFIRQHSLTIELLCDPNKDVLKTYGAWGKKQMYGKETEGVIRSTVLVDPEGMVRKHWPKAPSKGHAQEVLHELKRMAA